MIGLSNKLRCIVVIPELPLQYGLCSITVNVYCLVTLVNSSSFFSSLPNQFKEIF